MSVIICLFPVMTLAFSFSRIWRLLQLGGLKVSHMVLQCPSYHLRILPCRATGKYVKEGLGLDSRVLILGQVVRCLFSCDVGEGNQEQSHWSHAAEDHDERQSVWPVLLQTQDFTGPPKQMVGGAGKCSPASFVFPYPEGGETRRTLPGHKPWCHPC